MIFLIFDCFPNVMMYIMVPFPKICLKNNKTMWIFVKVFEISSQGSVIPLQEYFRANDFAKCATNSFCYMKGNTSILVIPMAFILRLPHMNDAKIAKMCNIWTFWLVIQLINRLFRIQKKAFMPNAP